MKRGTKARAGDRTDRKVLITGGASGFGLELAKQFLGRGDRVVVTDIHAEAPDTVLALGPRAEYRTLDVTSEDDWAAAGAAHPDIDVLVSNAGIAVGGRVERTSMETWQRAFDINFFGSVRGVRAFVPLLPDGAQIVLTASLAGLVHPSVMSTYNTTKAALVALAETLSFELAHRDIAVTAVCPTFFRSNLRNSLTGDDPRADDMAGFLLTRTTLTAETIARRAMRGIEARRVIVTTDSQSTGSFYLKRFARPLYLAAFRRVGKLGHARMQKPAPKSLKRGAGDGRARNLDA